MAGNLRNLPGAQFRKNVPGQRLALALETRNFFVDIDLCIVTDKPKLLDFCFEFCNRLFEIQELQVNNKSI